MAEAANIHLQVGAMLESRLAMTAFAHYALCSPMIEHFDFDTALMFSEDPVTGGIIYEKEWGGESAGDHRVGGDD